MGTRAWLAAAILCVGALLGCEPQPVPPRVPPPAPTADDKPKTSLAPARDREMAALRSKPLYEFSPREVDAYLKHLHATEPSLRNRIVHLARKNINQPYELYLLGEAPFEQIDAQPIYCLDKSDCVVFAEHTLAMALSDSWPSFMSMLQRIRYKDGRIGVVTRNHYTEADWNRNNTWLARDVTDEIGGESVVSFTQKVDRAKFLKGRYEIEEPISIETIEESFIPYERIESVKSRLRDGDIVNFVTGRDGGYWVGHVGLVARGSDGTVNLIHSAKPNVREEPVEAYIERFTRDAAEKDAAKKARFRGFKFLRLADDPIANLRVVDGAAAPRVTTPPGSMAWEKYLQSFDLGG
jgi:hypothetical protein